MAKWNLVRDLAGGEVVDVVEGSYSAASQHARKLEKDNNWEITIYESVW